jgi:two-component system response regulator (stage 0 sporulation protein F)
MKKKILLVEDEKALCLLYGRTAFDLIVTDIRMPGKNGIELITQIMGLRKDVPIVINSAYQSYKEDFMTWAADAYVVKSASLDELKAKIKELLGA